MTEKDIILREILEIQADIEFGSAPMTHIERLEYLQKELWKYSHT
jgi:hypothetical protein